MIRRLGMRPSFKIFSGAWAGLALAVGLGLSGCSDGTKETSSIEIVDWWTEGGEAQAIAALLAEFKKENPSVTIVDSSVDGGSTAARNVIRSRMGQNNPPDTFQANGGWDLMAWVVYNNKNAGLSKMQKIDDDARDWIDNVPHAVRDSVSYAEPGDVPHVYAVPLNIHRLNTLFYNKAVLERFKIDPAGLTSLDALFAAAETIKQMDPQISPFALGYGEKQSWTLALVFFENLLVARMGGKAYQDLFLAPTRGDAFTAQMTYALEDFRKLLSYANDGAGDLVWTKAMDRVLKGQAAMTIMGDWAKGYANAAGSFGETFGFMPMPGTAGTFVYTTDTFGFPIGGADDTDKLLKKFGSQDGQRIFNKIKGSISARLDVEVAPDDDRRPTYDDFSDANANGRIFAATSILAQQTWVDAMSAALAIFADNGPAGNASEVQHTMDNYADLLLMSCWPVCLQ